MKRDHASAPPVRDERLDAELDAENGEFDFANAPRPGRNALFERAQGHFHEVEDAKVRRSARPRSPNR